MQHSASLGVSSAAAFQGHEKEEPFDLCDEVAAQGLE